MLLGANPSFEYILGYYCDFVFLEIDVYFYVLLKCIKDDIVVCFSKTKTCT